MNSSVLTAVPALPMAVHSDPARPVAALRSAPAKQPSSSITQAPNAPASKATEPSDEEKTLGEDGKPDLFGRFLHRAIDQGEEPAPTPAPRTPKLLAPAPKPIVQGRAIGAVLTTVVHQERNEPLPSVFAIALPTAVTSLPATSQTAAMTSAADPSAAEASSALADRAALAPPAPTVEQPAPAGQEAFTVRLNSSLESSAAIKFEISKPDTHKPEDSQKENSAVESPRALATAAAKDKTGDQAPFEPSVTAAPIGVYPSLKPAPAHSPAPTPVTNIESMESPAPVATPSAPVRDLALHLPGTQGVEVRIAERSGEVRVEVRSGDQEFTQDLRDNLHELVSGLERKGFSAEVLHPAEHLFARAGETSSSNDSPSDNQHGAFAGDQEQKHRRQPDQKFDGRSPQARAAEWSESFNFNLETSNL